MFERVREGIRRWFLIKKLEQIGRKSDSEPVTFGNHWGGIESFLVCVTDRVGSAPDAVFSRIRSRFPQAQVTAIWLPETRVAVYATLLLDDRIRCIRLENSEINARGLPRPQLLEKLGNLRADVAIDLSLSFVPFSALLCQLSGARIKIGFVYPDSDLAFNFQVAPRSHEDGSEIYDAMARYIG